MASLPQDIPLGQPSPFASNYNPSLLRPISRAQTRETLSLDGDLPFLGEDLWTCYEFSWLAQKGIPRVAGLLLRIPCSSPCLIESKSLKLYLNSFAQTRFANRLEVVEALNSDIALAVRHPVLIDLLEIPQLESPTAQLPGLSLDELHVETDIYQRDPDLLTVADSTRFVRETCHTHLFRSLCPVTGQPDWASVMVRYAGAPLDRRGLLKYLISYRCHSGFHEQAIEQIFMDLKERCQMEQLTIYGRFQRRGGIDINPWRSTEEGAAPALRLGRQ